MDIRASTTNRAATAAGVSVALVIALTTGCKGRAPTGREAAPRSQAGPGAGFPTELTGYYRLAASAATLPVPDPIGYVVRSDEVLRYGTSTTGALDRAMLAAAPSVARCELATINGRVAGPRTAILGSESLAGARERDERIRTLRLTRWETLPDGPVVLFLDDRLPISDVVELIETDLSAGFALAAVSPAGQVGVWQFHATGQRAPSEPGPIVNVRDDEVAFAPTDREPPRPASTLAELTRGLRQANRGAHVTLVISGRPISLARTIEIVDAIAAAGITSLDVEAESETQRACARGGGLSADAEREARVRAMPDQASLAQQPSARGAIDLATIRRHLAAKATDFKYCYDVQRLARADLAGTVEATFTIGTDGAVTEVRAVGLLPELEDCIAAELREITFAAPRSGDTTVIWPFHFKPSPSP